MYNNSTQGKVWRQSSDPAASASENDVWIVTDGGGNPVSQFYRFQGAWVNGPTATLPTGSVSAFAGSSAPVGYVLCQGQALNRTTYAALFAVIGTTYGAGDGSTTFLAPDLRGEFVRGLDAGRGVDSGRALGTAQGGAIQSHRHRYIKGPTTLDSTWGDNATGYGNFGGGTPDDPAYTADTSPTGGTETRPRNVAMNYIIKT